MYFLKSSGNVSYNDIFNGLEVALADEFQNMFKFDDPIDTEKPNGYTKEQKEKLLGGIFTVKNLKEQLVTIHHNGEELSKHFDLVHIRNTDFKISFSLTKDTKQGIVHAAFIVKNHCLHIAKDRQDLDLKNSNRFTCVMCNKKLNMFGMNFRFCNDCDKWIELIEHKNNSKNKDTEFPNEKTLEI